MAPPIPEIPKSKTLGFLFIGVLLYLGSTYLNNQKSDSATLGVNVGLIIIGIAIAAQIVNWLIYWFIKKPKS